MKFIKLLLLVLIFKLFGCQWNNTTKINSLEEIVQEEFVLVVSGSGSIKVNGKSCSLPFGRSYEADSEIELEASLQDDFIKWDGDVVSNDNVIKVKMDRDKDVSVYFKNDLLSYSLKITSVASDKIIKINDIEHSLPIEQEFYEGDAVRLEVLANQNFLSWSGNLVCDADRDCSFPVYNLVMNQDLEIEVLYSSSGQNQESFYTLSVTGSVRDLIKINGVERYLPWSQSCLKNSNISLEFIDKDNFLQWSGDLAGSENPVSFSMDQDMSISVVYKYTGTKIIAEGVEMEEGSNLDEITFGLATKGQVLRAPPSPPDGYSCAIKLKGDDTDYIYKTVLKEEGRSDYSFFFQLDVHGTVKPEEKETLTTISWDPQTFDPDYNYDLYLQVVSMIFVGYEKKADMREVTSWQQTGTGLSASDRFYAYKIHCYRK